MPTDPSARLTKRPDWVPDWIWSAYQRVTDPMRVGLPPLPPSSIATLNRAIQDKGCKVAWNSMTQQRGKERSPFRTPTDPTYVSLHADAAEIVLARIPMMAAGPTPDEALTGSERKERCAKIAASALALQSALASARSPASWPDPFCTAFVDAVLTSAPQGKDAAATPWRAAAFYDPNATLDAILEILAPVATAAQAWSAARPLLPRPHDPQAARLRFIRQATALFRAMYRTSMREPVAALASALFDATDPSTVAKLAP